MQLSSEDLKTLITWARTATQGMQLGAGGESLFNRLESELAIHKEGSHKLSRLTTVHNDLKSEIDAAGTLANTVGARIVQRATTTAVLDLLDILIKDAK